MPLPSQQTGEVVERLRNIQVVARQHSPAHEERLALADFGLGELPFITQNVTKHAEPDRHKLVFAAQSFFQQPNRRRRLKLMPWSSWRRRF
jgi:hypothetical protein